MKENKMNLRQAIKIQKSIEEPWTCNYANLHWNRETIWKSRTVCRHHDNFKRRRGMPYIPTDDELTERLQWFASIMADACIEDEEEREAIKEKIWSE